MIWLVAPAFAADVSSNWAGSRWYLAIEETTPSPLELSAVENRSLRTRALQLEAVMSCPSAAPLGKSVEVTCRLDSLAIRATPRTTDPGEALNEGNPIVLADIVSRLEHTKVLLTIAADGRLTLVDLPDVTANNRRESDSREVLRRLVFDLVAGLSLDHPTDWQGGWTEKNTPLLRAPTQSSSSGMSKVVHTVSQIEGSTVIQSIGEGTFTAPYVPWEYAYEGGVTKYGDQRETVAGKSGGLGPAPSGGGMTAANDAVMTSAGPQASAATPTDYTFFGKLTGVTVVDPATTLPTQRIWAMLGHATASSIGNMQGLSLYYSGKIRKLGATEAVDMGMTEVVAPPGQTVEGIGIWQPMAVM